MRLMQPDREQTREDPESGNHYATESQAHDQAAVAKPLRRLELYSGRNKTL